jgi:hypothetical protein
LNGLAIVDGQPKFVTALGTTDVRDGRRADKPHGGCILDGTPDFVTPVVTTTYIATTVQSVYRVERRGPTIALEEL